MSSRGLSCVSYIAQERGEAFKKLTSTAGMERDVTKVQAPLCDEAFSIMTDWKDTNATPFERYMNWYKTRENSANK